MRKTLLLFLLIAVSGVKPIQAQGIYFPPITPGSNWDTLSPASLGWCLQPIDSLYAYLQNENTKGFILLKDGKIVLEKYFGNFTKDSLWYWASAGKTLTSFLVGRAKEMGILTLQDKTSQYLGTGWSNCTMQQEDSITIRHQLTMTTGLDDGVPDNHCTIDTCLNYLATAGSRWAYHNAPYTLLESVLENATSQNINAITNQVLKGPTGMTGLWYTTGFDRVYFSNTRSMARFGLLIQNNGIWDQDTILHDPVYKSQMLNSSQAINLSYGYLWWLNGKSSYMVPTSQLVFPGSYAPDAPADMVAGIGKNGQLVSISRNKGLVMVRMGESPSSPGSEVPIQLCNQIWKRLNEIMCSTVSLPDLSQENVAKTLYPNPATDRICLPEGTDKLELFDAMGNRVLVADRQHEVDIHMLKPGLYAARIYSGEHIYISRMMKR